MLGETYVHVEDALVGDLDGHPGRDGAHGPPKRVGTPAVAGTGVPLPGAPESPDKSRTDEATRVRRGLVGMRGSSCRQGSRTLGRGTTRGTWCSVYT